MTLMSRHGTKEMGLDKEAERSLGEKALWLVWMTISCFLFTIVLFLWCLIPDEWDPPEYRWHVRLWKIWNRSIITITILILVGMVIYQYF